jgi:folate-binding protein YgfZ
VAGPDGAPVWLVRARGLGVDGAWVFGARDALERRLEAAGVPHLAREVSEALRIRAGEPAWGAEITPEYFPMEVGLQDAIDYGKGCYLGQEPIVRIRDRGHINWRLVGLRLRGDQVPARGDAIESDVKPRAGRVTSAARLPGESPVALALLHVTVPVGAAVRVRHGDGLLPADVVDVGAA